MRKKIESWRRDEILMDTMPKRDELYALVDMLDYTQRDRLRAWLHHEIESDEAEEENPMLERVKGEINFMLPMVDKKDLELLLRVVRAFVKGLR